MASYAKQAQDETLYNHAVKIRTRATNQCGVLLKQHPKATTNHKGNKGDKKTPAPGFSKGRTQAAKDAGLSRRQAETAIAIASIPKKKFEALVESPKPPTLTPRPVRLRQAHGPGTAKARNHRGRAEARGRGRAR